MSWTAPRTWVALEIVTAAIMNTHVRDNFNFVFGSMWGQKIVGSVAGGAVASFDTNTLLGGNIPSGFRNLMVIWQGRSDSAAQQQAVNMRFNNDSGANYDTMHAIFGTTYAQTASNGSTVGGCGAMAANSDTAGAQGNGLVWIPNYSVTTLRKAATMQSAGKPNVDGTGQYEPRMGGFEWRSTAAVNRITLLPGGGNFMAGSSFDLYGYY